MKPVDRIVAAFSIRAGVIEEETCEVMDCLKRLTVEHLKRVRDKATAQIKAGVSAEQAIWTEGESAAACEVFKITAKDLKAKITQMMEKA